jgi:hypothetical protein
MDVFRQRFLPITLPHMPASVYTRALGYRVGGEF